MYNPNSSRTALIDPPGRDTYINGSQNGHLDLTHHPKPGTRPESPGGTGKAPRKTWAIKTRIIVGFGTLIAILIVFAISSYVVVGSLAYKINDIDTNWLPGVIKLSEVAYDQKVCMGKLLEGMTTTDPTLTQKHHDEVIELLNKSEKDLKDYEGDVSRPPDPTKATFTTKCWQLLPS